MEIMTTQIITLAENDKYIVQGRYADWSTRSQKTRIDGSRSTEAMVAAIGAAPAYTVYGEDPTNDAAWKAYNRAEVKQMKQWILEVNAELGFLPTDGFKLSYSRTAGCSCGCSPAFILALSTGRRLSASGADETSPYRYNGFEYVWITVK